MPLLMSTKLSMSVGTVRRIISLRAGWFSSVASSVTKCVSRTVTSVFFCDPVSFLNLFTSFIRDNKITLMFSGVTPASR